MIQYRRPERVFLFGGGSVMAKFHEWLEAQDFSVCAFTAPRQAGDNPKATVLEDINGYAPFIDMHDLGICFGPAWTFGPEIRAAFGNRLIDFMSIPYPSYLGGAHISWARMMGETQWGCCMQMVTENTVQGECHDGDVLASASFEFWGTDLEAVYLQFLIGFMGIVDRQDQITPIDVDETARFYLPRLNTGMQGCVDWDWTGTEIVRFIKAFDAPYQGAWTYIEGKRVSLHDATDYHHRDSHQWHPFQNGLIVSADTKGPRCTVIAGGCEIELEIRCEGHKCFWALPGMRLHTPAHDLEHAKGYRPNYTATGDANAR